MTTPTTARPTDGSHLPAFHLNGTGRQALLDQAEVVYRALHEAYLTMCEAGPHGRDYYVLGEDAYQRAYVEHRRRLTALEALRDDACADYLELASRA